MHTLAHALHILFDCLIIGWVSSPFLLYAYNRYKAYVRPFYVIYTGDGFAVARDSAALSHINTTYVSRRMHFDDAKQLREHMNTHPQTIFPPAVHNSAPVH